MFGVTQCAEGGEVVRLLHPSQYQTADTDLRFLSIDFLNLENSFCVMIPKFVAELVTARRDRTHAAPFAIADFEDLIYQVLRHQISFSLNDAGILVFDVPFTLFELSHRHENSFENIQGLESGDHNWNVKALRDGLVFS